jgi:hypothetical protein
LADVIKDSSSDNLPMVLENQVGGSVAVGNLQVEIFLLKDGTDFEIKRLMMCLKMIMLTIVPYGKKLLPETTMIDLNDLKREKITIIDIIIGLGKDLKREILPD